MILWSDHCTTNGTVTRSMKTTGTNEIHPELVYKDRHNASNCCDISKPTAWIQWTEPSVYEVKRQRDLKKKKSNQFIHIKQEKRSQSCHQQRFVLFHLMNNLKQPLELPGKHTKLCRHSVSLTKTRPVNAREPPNLLETFPIRRRKYLKSCLQSCFPSLPSSSFNSAHAAMAVTASICPSVERQLVDVSVAPCCVNAAPHKRLNDNLVNLVTALQTKSFFFLILHEKNDPPWTSSTALLRLLTFSQTLLLTHPPPTSSLAFRLRSLSPP